MITEALLDMAIGLLEWFVSVVPDFGLDLSSVDLAGFWHQVGVGAAALNGWVPAFALVAVLSLLLVSQVAMSAWGLLVWVYHQFWGSS